LGYSPAAAERGGFVDRYIGRHALHEQLLIGIQRLPPGPVDARVIFANAAKQALEQLLQLAVRLRRQVDTRRVQEKRRRDLVTPAGLATIAAVIEERIVVAVVEREMTHAVRSGPLVEG